MVCIDVYCLFNQYTCLQMVVLVVTGLLASSCSAAKVPLLMRYNMCMDVCSQHFMKCARSCKYKGGDHKCVKALNKCRLKCTKLYRKRKTGH